MVCPARAALAVLGLLRQAQQRAAGRRIEPPDPRAFEQQHASEQRVHWRRRNSDLVLGGIFASKPSSALQGTSDEKDWEQREIGVGHPDDREPGACEAFTEIGAAVSANFMTQN